MPNAKVNDLNVAAWSATPLLERRLYLTRFNFSDDAQSIVLEWCRQRSKKYDGPIKMTLYGLSEVTGFIVPDTAFVREDWDEHSRSFRLSFYFLEDRRADAQLRRQMQFALSQWLGALFPTKPGAMRSKAAACAGDGANWSIVDVSSLLTQRSDGAACPNPQDGLLWDTVTAYAVAAVAGKQIAFHSDDRRTLVARTPQGQLFDGVELVVYSPKASPDGKKFWSEVVTLCVATFPEQKGIFVLARLSLRNWGPVTTPQRRSGPHRTLDVFMEPEPAFAGTVAGAWRHGSFEYHAEQDRSGAALAAGQRPAVLAAWRHQPDRDIFRLLQSFTGNTEANQASLAQPVLHQAGLSILPRLGSGHGDDRLSGGTGLPWPDREAITDSLDKLLTSAGLERTKSMRRINRRSRNSPKVWGNVAEWRQSVLVALNDLGNEDKHLDLFIFRLRDDTTNSVLIKLKEFLGEPAEEQGGLLRWSDGLIIRVVDCPAGPLAEQLSQWPTLTAAELAKCTNEQQRRAFEYGKHQEEVKKAQRAMADHIRKARGGSNEGVACALLEMSADLQKDPWRDPFGLARQELARARCLPKVMLLDGEEQSEHKCRFALRDLLRMLGVSPLATTSVQNERTLAAITIIQRNRKIVSGLKRDHHAFPIAVQVRNGVIRCALPTAEGMVWQPYGEAALRVLTGDYKHFDRSRENERQFSHLFANIFEDLSRGGECLVMVAKDKVAKVHTLDNGSLEFDQLILGGKPFRAGNPANLRVIRIDSGGPKQPCYSHGTDAKWPSGLFQWGTGERTLYALKPKPSSVSMKSSFALNISRHEPPLDSTSGTRSYTDTVRQTPQLGEFCVAVKQSGDDPHEWIGSAFALCGVHVQYDAYTNLPFPLHELVSITKNVVGVGVS